MTLLLLLFSSPAYMYPVWGLIIMSSIELNSKITSAKTAERNLPSSEIASGGQHCFCAQSQKPAPL